VELRHGSGALATRVTIQPLERHGPGHDLQVVGRARRQVEAVTPAQEQQREDEPAYDRADPLPPASASETTDHSRSLHLAQACRQGRRVRFFTAGNLVTPLEEAQKQYQLDRFLAQLDRADLLICDELGYLSFSRGGAELLFQVFADRYERASLLVTSNLAFSDWGQVFQGERMTAALLDA